MWDAIVRESTPYLIAIYTRRSWNDSESSEISGVGLYQLGQIGLCYQ